MARVLCAWEFGGDLGHVRRLMPIARELRAMGHSTVFAFRDSAYLHGALAEGFEAFVAPILRVPAAVTVSPLNFSDILLNLGFDDPHGLHGALRAWRSMYTLIAPDVVVADYAPTALLAASTMGLARVTVGTGFSQPRIATPLPALRSWQASDPNVLRAIDDRVVNAVAAALAGVSDRVPRTAADLFEADAHLLCTFAEIDPFGPRADVDYVGPQGDATSGVGIDWPEAGRARVFAYLKPADPRFAAVLAALARLDADVIVAAPGLAPEAALTASHGSMRVLASTVNLERIMGTATLCVCHAGPGVVARGLAAGVPFALLPQHLEQYLVAQRMRDGGSAELISPDEPPPDFHAWLSGVLARADLARAARVRAEGFRGYSFAAGTRRAAERIAAAAGA
jgi:UDP:flavonoid glycosyltransferase YjiC (YdhE family)